MSLMLSMPVIALALVAPSPGSHHVMHRAAVAPSMVLRPFRQQVGQAAAPRRAQRERRLRPFLASCVSAVKSWRPRSWRTKAAIADALLTVGLRATEDTAAEPHRNLAETGWEDTLLPTTAGASRKCAKLAGLSGWEERLLPSAPLHASFATLTSWEDRLLPALGCDMLGEPLAGEPQLEFEAVRASPRSTARVRHCDLDWDDHFFTAKSQTPAHATTLRGHLSGWEERLLGAEGEAATHAVASQRNLEDWEDALLP